LHLLHPLSSIALVVPVVGVPALYRRCVEGPTREKKAPAA